MSLCVGVVSLLCVGVGIAQRNRGVGEGTAGRFICT